VSLVLVSVNAGNDIVHNGGIKTHGRDLIRGPVVLDVCREDLIQDLIGGQIILIYSEPPGARVYEGGRLKGTAPFIAKYTLQPSHYKNGEFVVKPLVAAKEGCIPKEHKLTFKIDPEWRYMQGETFEEGTVFLLQIDPNYKPPPQPVVVSEEQSTQKHHLTIKNEDSFLDEALKFMQIMSIGQTLTPTLKQ
jgi:hypothetical protein